MMLNGTATVIVQSASVIIKRFNDMMRSKKPVFLVKLKRLCLNWAFFSRDSLEVKKSQDMCL